MDDRKLLRGYKPLLQFRLTAGVSIRVGAPCRREQGNMPQRHWLLARSVPTVRTSTVCPKPSGFVDDRKLLRGYKPLLQFDKLRVYLLE